MHVAEECCSDSELRAGNLFHFESDFIVGHVVDDNSDAGALFTKDQTMGIILGPGGLWEP